MSDLHRAALARHREGDGTGAVALLRQALAAAPEDADLHNSLGVLEAAGGDHQAAASCFAAAIRLAPLAARHHANLGLALRDLGRPGPAIAALRDAATLDPADCNTRLQLGLLLRAEGDVDAAAAALLEAVALRPDDPGVNMILATVLHTASRMRQAVPFYDRVIRLAPDQAAAHAARALALQELDRLEEAIAGHRAALALRPDLLETRCNLARALRGTGAPDSALREAEIAVRTNGQAALAQSCVGFSRLAMGDLPGGIAALRRCVELPPLTPEQAVTRAQIQLLLGDPAGWQGMEQRWARLPPPESFRRMPRWDGGDLAGRRILLFWEQGYGDTLQFLRYVPAVAARARQVLLCVQPQIAPLLAPLAGVTVLTGVPADLPEHDVHFPLMSLPMHVPDPAPVPYLTPSRRIPRFGAGLQVGLAWSGRRAHGNDRHRSVGLAALACVRAVPGCVFHAVQTEIAEADADLLQGMHDHRDTLVDFADTAALIAGLDLVISVDTAVAHLAGALGTKLWLLLPAVPDWRWGLERDDTRWYPQARLFRQPRDGDWQTALTAVAQALQALSET